MNGLLIPVGDEKAMENGINRLIEDQQLAQRLGRQAHRIREKINGQAILLQWKSYIEEILQGQR